MLAAGAAAARNANCKVIIWNEKSLLWKPSIFDSQFPRNMKIYIYTIVLLWWMLLLFYEYTVILYILLLLYVECLCDFFANVFLSSLNGRLVRYEQNRALSVCTYHVHIYILECMFRSCLWHFTRWWLMAMLRMPNGRPAPQKGGRERQGKRHVHLYVLYTCTSMSIRYICDAIQPYGAARGVCVYVHKQKCHMQGKIQHRHAQKGSINWIYMSVCI